MAEEAAEEAAAAEGGGGGGGGAALPVALTMENFAEKEECMWKDRESLLVLMYTLLTLPTLLTYTLLTLLYIEPDECMLQESGSLLVNFQIFDWEAGRMLVKVRERARKRE